MMPVRRKLRQADPKMLAEATSVDDPITAEDFQAALAKTRSSISQEQLQRFKKWADDYGAVWLSRNDLSQGWNGW